MDKKILSEELGRMSYLFGHKRGVVVSEQAGNLTGVERKKEGFFKRIKNKKLNFNWGKKTKGNLNFVVTSDPKIYASFINNEDLFQGIGNQRLGISSISLSPKLIGKSYKTPMPIILTFSLNDPFKFDRTDLSDTGEVKFQDFIKKYEETKSEHGNIWSSFLESIKKNGGVKIFGYASQDSNPNDNDGGRLPACSTYGVGKGPRSQYNLCLSQKRAEIIMQKLIQQLPELDGMVTAIGKGETCDDDLCWTKNNRITPNQTSKNRRFEIIFPKYISDVDSGISVKDSNVTYNSLSEVNWDLVNTYVDLTEYGFDKIKAAKDKQNMIMISREDAEKIAGSVPIIGPSTINGSSYGFGKVNGDSFILKSGEKTHKFKGWRDPEYLVGSSVPDETLFKVTEPVLAIIDNPLRLVSVSITLNYI